MITTPTVAPAEANLALAAAPAAGLEADHERRARRHRALYELRELTGISPEELKLLPHPLLKALETQDANPAACVLEYFAPRWRGAPLDVPSRTYTVEGLVVPADSWRMIRALLHLDEITFDVLFREKLVSAQFTAAQHATKIFKNLAALI
jgi:hypothetical protein